MVWQEAPELTSHGHTKSTTTKEQFSVKEVQKVSATHGANETKTHTEAIKEAETWPRHKPHLVLQHTTGGLPTPSFSLRCQGFEPHVFLLLLRLPPERPPKYLASKASKACVHKTHPTLQI